MNRHGSSGCAARTYSSKRSRATRNHSWRAPTCPALLQATQHISCSSLWRNAAGKSATAIGQSSVATIGSSVCLPNQEAVGEFERKALKDGYGGRAHLKNTQKCRCLDNCICAHATAAARSRRPRRNNILEPFSNFFTSYVTIWLPLSWSKWTTWHCIAPSSPLPSGNVNIKAKSPHAQTMCLRFCGIQLQEHDPLVAH